MFSRKINVPRAAPTLLQSEGGREVRREGEREEGEGGRERGRGLWWWGDLEGGENNRYWQMLLSQ